VPSEEVTLLDTIYSPDKISQPVLIHDRIEFHNVSSLERLAELPGLMLSRYPREVRESLATLSQADGISVRMAQESTGCELRFVAAFAHTTRLFLSSPFYDTTVQVFCGDYAQSEVALPAGRLVTLELMPPANFCDVAAQPLAAGSRFAPQVWRVIGNRAPVFYHGIDANGCEVRPPRADEKPRLRLLAYGSSITHGTWKSYPYQAGFRLGLDVLNKGLAGSCFCQPEIAEHLACGETWDIATLELGVNMRGRFTPDEFRARASQLIATLRRHHPAAPLGVITTFPNYADHLKDRTRVEAVRDAAYRDILREIVAAQHNERVLLIEGSGMLPVMGGLSTDLLHPSEFGQMVMGERLAEALRPLLALLPAG